MSTVAIFGSRRGVSKDRVVTWIENLYQYEPEDVIVSGGAKGTDTWAEQTWLGLGGKVISFRPVKLSEGRWSVERWDLGVESPSCYNLAGEPTWASFSGAAFYRNMLIAEIAEKGVAFRYRHSPGTSATIDAFAAEGKPCYVYEEQNATEED